MKFFTKKATTAFLAAVLFVGQLSTNLACFGFYYQPEVPEDLRK